MNANGPLAAHAAKAVARREDGPLPFEICPPRRSTKQALAENTAKLRRSGVLVVHRDTLHLVGVDGQAVVLVDKATRRLALRKPADGEGKLAIKPRADKTAEKAGAVAFAVGFALKQQSWATGKSARFHGFKRVVCRNDGLAIVLLEGEKGEQ